MEKQNNVVAITGYRTEGSEIFENVSNKKIEKIYNILGVKKKRGQVPVSEMNCTNCVEYLSKTKDFGECFERKSPLYESFVDEHDTCGYHNLRLIK